MEPGRSWWPLPLWHKRLWLGGDFGHTSTPSLPHRRERKYAVERRFQGAAPCLPIVFPEISHAACVYWSLHPGSNHGARGCKSQQQHRHFDIFGLDELQYQSLVLMIFCGTMLTTHDTIFLLAGRTAGRTTSVVSRCFAPSILHPSHDENT